MRRFSRFACIDWSGAVGEFPPGLALADIDLGGAPKLIGPERRWSRTAIFDWLLKLADAGEDILIGLDLSLGFPFMDHGSFFPEWSDSPSDARALWAMIDSLCAADRHLSATSFLAHPEARRHFRHAKGDVGDLFEGGIGRLREVERHQRATKQANSWSCFNLVGAGQVGKSSLTGMRMMHRLGGRIPVWPFDPLPESGPVIIEIYTTMAARAAGLPANTSKIRDAETLAKALATFDADAPASLHRLDDHATDALLTAAWMRKASQNPLLWSPELLTPDIAQTEGWTFGVI
ncbi:MAG: hypothetical protein IPG54_04065 [Sphingomonadales bacterium]|jgi:hypothetical protein|nr:hypothetical protein [Sphingomonadales bacterium]MBK9003055.1 hypothetical protein [Sphingomonadales bacterium]MBK9268303.1 hypothetical protein [Sphingomonadales bacterium]MBP6434570.1 hypothetical protein [Sphingorhabdus sp.]